MYTLKEIVETLPWITAENIWDNKMVCVEGHVGPETGTLSFDGISVYGFVLVLDGSIHLRYRGKEILFSKGEMQVYAPFMTVTILGYSSDFKGISLFFDKAMMDLSPMRHQLFRDAYAPLQSHRAPKITLNAETAGRVESVMRLIRLHIGHFSEYKRDKLYSLCEVFLVDLLEAQGLSLLHTVSIDRAGELLQQFFSLVHEHFASRHDLPFYAERLCITTTYLSRLVRQVCNCTAKEIINRAITAEAEYLLRTTTLTSAQIADRLCFADQASFNHFFSRQKGISPSNYKKLKLE